ncbi:MAG: hypothetical protein RL030_765 [Pseudomonadota bacterium]|jgi:uncharacterized lipoprotein
MTIENRFRIAALCAVLAFAGGCKSLTGKTCNDSHAYDGSREMAPMKIPPGLKGLDTRRAVVIPDLNEPAAPRGPDDPCIDEPPRYSNADLKAPTRIVPAPPSPPAKGKK